MEIVRIAVIGLVAAIFAVVIKKKQPEISMQISIAAGLLIFIYIIEYLVKAVDYIKNTVNKFNIPIGNITLVFKIIGIAYISEFAVNILKDAGENSIAVKVELAGKLMIIILSLPLITSFVELVLDLVE